MLITYSPWVMGRNKKFSLKWNSHLVDKKSIRVWKVDSLNSGTDDSEVWGIIKDFLSLDLKGFIWSNHTVHFNFYDFKNMLSAHFRVVWDKISRTETVHERLKVRWESYFWNSSFIFVSSNGIILTFHFVIKNFSSSKISSPIFLKISWWRIPNWIKEMFFFDIKSSIEYAVVNIVWTCF